MLVILSDIHLTDETTSFNVKPEAFEEHLKHEIDDNAKANDARELHIMLLGDIFDLVRTAYWQTVPEDERPWYGKLDKTTGMNTSNKVQKHFEQVLTDILATRSAQALVAMCNRLARDHGQTGIPVRVSYVVGNHDRAFWNFPSLQKKLRAAFSEVTLNGKNGKRFALCDHLKLPQYGVLARHGHEWDDNSYALKLYNKVLNRRKQVQRFDPTVNRVMSIGEVITAELMSGLIHRVEGKLDDMIIHDLKDANNVRPMTDLFAWLDWFAGSSVKRDNDVIFNALRDSLGAVLDSSFARLWDKTESDFFFTGDITDTLSKLRTTMPVLGFSGLKTGVSIFKGIGGSGDDFLNGAAAEWKSMDPTDLKRLQYIVYGHTHRALHECFAADTSGRVRMYINTGTYQPLIEQTRDGAGFSSAHRMTMLFFYRKDEDTDNKAHNDLPTLDLWNGIKRKAYAERQ